MAKQTDSEDNSLDLRTKEAIRKYLLQIFAIPAVILSIGGFAIGYLIEKGSDLTAQQRVQKEVDEANVKLDQFYQEATTKITETRFLLNEVNKTKNNIDDLVSSNSVLQTLAEDGQSIDKIALKISQDPNMISKINSNFFKTYRTQDGGYTFLGDLMICWGSALTNYNPNVNPHTREFSFVFPKNGFKEPPYVANSINTNSNGTIFGIYAIDPSADPEKKYQGTLNNHGGKTEAFKVHMSYIAIGLKK